MPRGRVLTEEIKKRIGELADRGLTAGEIAGALRINTDTVRKYLEVKKDVGEPENHHGSEQKAGKRGDRDPDSHQPAEDRRPAIDHTENIIPAGGEKITFIGGKKHQGGKTDMSNKEGKEDFEYECPKCHHQFNGTPDKCPKCGAELQE